MLAQYCWQYWGWKILNKYSCIWKYHWFPSVNNKTIEDLVFLFLSDPPSSFRIVVMEYYNKGLLFLLLQNKLAKNQSLYQIFLKLNWAWINLESFWLIERPFSKPEPSVIGRLPKEKQFFIDNFPCLSGQNGNVFTQNETDLWCYILDELKSYHSS